MSSNGSATGWAGLRARDIMTAEVYAVPPDARLILLGDPDQLQSVEHGAVLGDICASLAGPRSSALAEFIPAKIQ